MVRALATELTQVTSLDFPLRFMHVCVLERDYVWNVSIYSYVFTYMHVQVICGLCACVWPLHLSICEYMYV